MAYNTFLYFGLFLTITYAIWLLMPVKKRPLVLLGASLVFYWASSGRYIFWFLLAAAVTWAAGLAIARLDELFAETKENLAPPARKALKKKIAGMKHSVMAAGTVVLLAFLVVLKYAPFLLRNLNAVLSRLPLSPAIAIPAWVLPLGISFYSLMAVGYVVDVARGSCKPAQKYWQVLLYLGFWPHIVEGPFDRFADVAPALLYEDQHPSYQNLAFGAQRIVWGLFKKGVVADRINPYVRAVYGDYTKYSGVATLAGTLLYTIQLYAEFSGAMDIVLGSAEIFGIPLAENFRQPYLSRSVGEFWRRWHITLGAWLREYLFQPFIMSKPVVKFGKLCREKLGPWAGRNLPVWLGLTVTWAAIGLWHGAGWIYLLYGLYYCFLQLLGQAAEPWLVKKLPRLPAWREQPAYKAWQVLRTFLLVNVGMLLFNSASAGVALYMLRHIFTPYTGSLLIEVDARDMGVILIGTAMIALVDLLHGKNLDIRKRIAARPLPLRWLVYIGGVLLVMVFGAYGDNYDPAAFIYAQF